MFISILIIGWIVLFVGVMAWLSVRYQSGGVPKPGPRATRKEIVLYETSVGLDRVRARMSGPCLRVGGVLTVIGGGGLLATKLLT
jgi:hypothetical protein